MANSAFIPEIADRDVYYHLRDNDPVLVAAWKEEFRERKKIKISEGEIFNGTSKVDAVVTPSNSFGFMNGGIDGVCRTRFGQQIQVGVQDVIRTRFDGEVLVGQAFIIPTHDEKNGKDAIKYLIYAPTMRIPSDVSDTINAYLCFKAVLLAVRHHNHTNGNIPIRDVLVPGLGTGMGQMPKVRCAHQMLQAYDTFVTEIHPLRVAPNNLQSTCQDHEGMRRYRGKAGNCKMQ